MYKHCFPLRTLWTNRNGLQKSGFRFRGKTRVPGKNPVEASSNQKPNGHAALVLGVEPRLSGPQHWGSTANLPASPFMTISVYCRVLLKISLIQNFHMALASTACQHQMCTNSMIIFAKELNWQEIFYTQSLKSLWFLVV